MGKQARGRSRRFVGLVVALWLAAVVLPPLGLAGWRTARLAELKGPGVQADWDTFRDAMREQSGRTGPVQRKVPKSAEPPELVWLRDYFWLAVAAWVILGGTLGGFFALVVLGVASADPPSGRASAEP
jgi:hypothetical protein